VSGLASVAAPFSTEFEIPGEWGYATPYAAAVFDPQLWLIGADGGRRMRQLTLQLVPHGEPLNIETDVANKANWSSSELEIPGAKGPWTASRCGAAPVGDALHLVWNSHGEGCALRASRYTMSGDGGLGWQQAVTLVPQGDPNHRALVAAPSAEVSVTGVGDDTLIVACSNARAWWAKGEPATIYIGTFNVNDIDQSNNTWPARSDIWGGPTPNPPFGPDYPFPPILDYIAIDWFTAAGQGGPSDEPADRSPSSYLWVSLASPIAFGSSLAIPLDTTKGTVDFANRLYGYMWWGPEAVRDPAGRIRSYMSDERSGDILVWTFSTYSAPDPTNHNFPLPPDGGVAIKTAGLSSVSPTAAFVTQLTKPTEANYTDKAGKTHTGTQYPVYEFVVYGKDHAWCHVDRFGTAQVFPKVYLGTPTPRKGHEDVMIPSGIIDGPIPIPAPNLAKATADDKLGTVTYSTTSSASTEHSVSNSFTAGFMSEGEMTKGFGPAWDISLKGGMGYVQTDGTTTSQSEAEGEEAVVDSAKKVDPLGTIWGAAASFLWTAYRFLDANGNPIADSFAAGSQNQAPLFTTVSCTFDPGASTNYMPYAVTPGDLDSYTPEEWNDRMSRLGYPGNNYFEEVIDAYAYKFTETRNYLKASWTPTGTSQQNFEAATTNFIETSWTLDRSSTRASAAARESTSSAWVSRCRSSFWSACRFRTRRRPQRT
jgi:hypothetical protein